MYLQTSLRFISAVVGAFAAFYLGAVLFNATGHLSNSEFTRVNWMYRQLLSPITSMDWVAQKTSLIVAGALLLQALLLGALFRHWAYRPLRKVDPLRRQATLVGTIEASGARLPSHETPMYSGIDHDETGTGSRAPANPAVEQARLMSLLGSGT